MAIGHVFGTDTPVIGMVHLPPLPGSPGFDGDREGVRERAVADARALAAGGVDGLLVENYGDAPFYPDEVPAHVVASMTAVTQAVKRAVELPVGVNVLRNDATAAISIAAATGAAFVRVNVHTGARVTDQGVIQGRAHETIRLRDRLGADVRVFADVAVKHSSPLGPESDVVAEMADLERRGLADAVIVTGGATGESIDADWLASIVERREAAGLSTPLLVGSGVDPANVSQLLAAADGAIVGTAFKSDDDPASPVDRRAVERLLEGIER